jgi:hypothetical protein
MTRSEIMETLRSACEQRKVCRAHFFNEPEERLINPLGVAYSSKNTLIIVCILVKGFSESKNTTFFRNLQFVKCEKVEVLDRRFTVDKDFNPEDGQYKTWLFHAMMKPFPEKILFV